MFSSPGQCDVMCRKWFPLKCWVVLFVAMMFKDNQFICRYPHLVGHGVVDVPCRIKLIYKMVSDNTN